MWRPYGEVIGEVVATNWNRSGVGHGPLKENDQLGRAGADVDKTGSELALIGGNRSLGGGNRLKNCVCHFQSGLVRAGDDALHRARRTGRYVEIDLKTVPHHPYRVVDTRLFVQDELLRQQVNDLPAGGK